MVDEQLIHKSLIPYFGDTNVIETKELADGAENTSIYIRLFNNVEIVLRYWGEKHGYIGKRKDTDIEYELSFMMFFKNKGLQIPKIYKTKSGELYAEIERRKYCVIEYVKGESTSVYNESKVVNIANIMANMHLVANEFNYSTKRNWPGSIIDMTLDRIEFMEDNFPNVKLSIKGRLEGVINEMVRKFKTDVVKVDLEKLPQGPIHGDIMIENIKFIGNKVEGVFDFDDCRNSYFLEDITKTLLFRFESESESIFGSNGSNIQLFLDEYQKVRKLTKYEISSLSLFYQARILYQIGGYYIKYSKGNDEYKDLIEKVIERYNSNNQFF